MISGVVRSTFECRKEGIMRRIVLSTVLSLSSSLHRSLLSLRCYSLFLISLFVILFNSLSSLSYILMTYYLCSKCLIVIAAAYHRALRSLVYWNDCCLNLIQLQSFQDPLFGKTKITRFYVLKQTNDRSFHDNTTPRLCILKFIQTFQDMVSPFDFILFPLLFFFSFSLNPFFFLSNC